MFIVDIINKQTQEVKTYYFLKYRNGIVFCEKHYLKHENNTDRQWNIRNTKDNSMTLDGKNALYIIRDIPFEDIKTIY